MSGLRFRSEPYDKVWDKTYKERWVCDLGHFEVIVALGLAPHDQIPQSYVRFANGTFQAAGASFEAALETVLNRFYRTKSYLAAEHGSTWLKALEDERKGHMNAKQRKKMVVTLGVTTVILLDAWVTLVIWT